jgi:hypothetical protein
MLVTDYHAKYLAHELTKRCASDSIEKLAAILADAQVDLNPHPERAVCLDEGFAENDQLKANAVQTFRTWCSNGRWSIERPYRRTGNHAAS